MDIGLITQILGGLATLVGKVGGKKKEVEKLSSMLALAGKLIGKGEAGRAKLVELRDMVQRMVDEGRAPSDAEWKALTSRYQAASDAIAASGEAPSE